MNAAEDRSLRARLAGSPFQGYAYAYPHKTAYRPLRPPTTWRDAWADEDASSLFLYVHVPYCTVRCGLCNLFATRGPSEHATEIYLASQRRQMDVVAAALGPNARFSRMALGGGTPTFLSATQLHVLMGELDDRFGVSAGTVPCSVETSPETASDDRLAVLEAAGVSRLSIGVQAFDEESCRAMGRPHLPNSAHDALQRIRRHHFDTLNIDLIYGADGQSGEAFEASIKAALRYEPEEVYLYPLYVRQLTGLGRRDWRPDDARVALYRRGRDLLRAVGYRQVSMRMFSRSPLGERSSLYYCCQRDGMVGLGPGARSYTSSLHYSTEYAVGQTIVRSIIEDYAERGEEQHARQPISRPMIHQR